MIQVPAFEETAELADWAELSCLFGDRSSISRSEVVDALDAAGLSDPDSKIENIWSEIEHRHSIAPKFYPLVTSRSRIELTLGPDQTFAYAFQLLISTHSFYSKTKISKRDWNMVAKLFETLTTCALGLYLRGRSVNVGAPRKGGVPASFRKCLDYMSKQLGELRGAVKSYNANKKDDHLDVLSWLPFGDRRAGQVIVLLQCAAGADWERKGPELSGSMRIWESYIDFAVSPLAAFAFPFVCLEEEKWRYLSKQAGVLLDRLRITSLCHFDTVEDNLRRILVKWCKSQALRLPKP